MDREHELPTQATLFTPRALQQLPSAATRGQLAARACPAALLPRSAQPCLSLIGSTPRSADFPNPCGCPPRSSDVSILGVARIEGQIPSPRLSSFPQTDQNDFTGENASSTYPVPGLTSVHPAWQLRVAPGLNACPRKRAPHPAWYCSATCTGAAVVYFSGSGTEIARPASRAVE